MHVVFFGLKRAYHGTLRITREPLREIGLTPARFDLLYAVKECRGGVLQSALRKILGVCRATVSKMLISLEQLGLVKRTVYKYDRRQRLVRLTGYGRGSIRDAKKDFMRSGWAELAFASAIGSTGLCPWNSEDSCFEQKTWLLARLDALRKGFFDFASLEYPRTHAEMPDDLEDRAFAEPWEDIAIREQREGLDCTPPGAREWSWAPESVLSDDPGACVPASVFTCEAKVEPPRRHGTGASIHRGNAPPGAADFTRPVACPAPRPLRFPWDDEGSGTWEEASARRREKARRQRSKRSRFARRNST